MSDIDTVAVDSLKALDPQWPIREADMRELASICPLSADCAKVAVKKVWNWILKQTNQYECALESKLFRRARS